MVLHPQPIGTSSQISLSRWGQDPVLPFRASMIQDGLNNWHLRIVATTSKSIIVGVAGWTADVLEFERKFSPTPPTLHWLSSNTSGLVRDIILTN